jgi:hypothetical protein
MEDQHGDRYQYQLQRQCVVLLDRVLLDGVAASSRRVRNAELRSRPSVPLR